MLLASIAKTENKIFRIKLSLELAANAKELVTELSTDNIGELLLFRSICLEHDLFVLDCRSGFNRQSLAERIHISTDLLVAHTLNNSGIRLGLEITFTHRLLNTSANSSNGILRELELSRRIVQVCQSIAETLNRNIFINAMTRLPRKIRKILKTELSTKHVGKLFVICRVRRNSSNLSNRFLGFTACNQSKSGCTKSNLFQFHFFRLLSQKIFRNAPIPIIAL